MIRHSDYPLAHLSAERAAQIRKRYDTTHRNFIASMLKEDQLRIIDETYSFILRDRNVKVDNIEGIGVEDYFVLARVEHMMRYTPQDANAYSRYHVTNPKDREHYLRLEKFWLQEEISLLERRLGRPPTTNELKDDARVNQTGLRFCIFYCLKFPDRVKEQEA
ncbi:MAG: hypothetical protein KJ718_03030 [Nanoarchaeota archaeon]|nr:hypothetical protein [Nanoarchaeota archaeon]MBU1051503.1 hypothetical protein [Nanoarchaeota archaeon]MBU1988687.1 hypothetical protein [Nanoarchaeota archaeon]